MIKPRFAHHGIAEDPIDRWAVNTLNLSSGAQFLWICEWLGGALISRGLSSQDRGVEGPQAPRYA